MNNFSDGLGVGKNMKNNAKYFIYLWMMISLAACGKSSSDKALEALQTEVSLTVVVQLTETALISTATPSAIVTHQPTPTIITTVIPTKLPSDVQASLVIETLDAFDGHGLRRISGWSDGFDGFKWVDSRRLLIHPITGMRWYSEHGSNNPWASYTALINLDSGKVWLPPTELYLLSFLQKASGQLVVLLADTDTATLMYSLDGDLLKTYKGTLLGVSPSGSKIILASNASDPNTGTEITWIDLLNNKEVMFDWEQSASSYDCCRPIWSSDEMSVYTTSNFGNFYANAKTGESYRVSYTSHAGEDADHLIGSPHHSYGTWVFNNSYLLASWDEHDEGTPGYVSFFDPAKKAYRNLSALAGLPYLFEMTAVDPDNPPYPCDNGHPIASGGRYVWVNCQDGGRLIDMQTFKAKSYPDYSQAILEWSADGSFAFLSYSHNDPDPQILSAVSNQLSPMPDKALCYAWHPKQNIFLYLSSDKKTLSIFNAQSTLVQQQVILPKVVYQCPKWNTRGDKIIMIVQDDSLWQIDYPSYSNLEQLTKSIRGVKYFAVSPDDRLIALSVEPDIYLIDTRRKP